MFETMLVVEAHRDGTTNLCPTCHASYMPERMLEIALSCNNNKCIIIRTWFHSLCWILKEI